MITTIIFDVGGVLMSWPKDAVYADLKNELELDETEFALFWRKYLPLYGERKITEPELWEKARKDFGIRRVSPKENLLGREFAAATEVYVTVLEKAGELKKRKFKIAILSNTNDVHSEIMRQKKIFEPFEHVFLSQVIGIRKPSPKIYMHALSELNSKPDETVFIDDTLENVEAAKKLGMHTILARSPEQIIKDIEKLI